MLKELQLTNFKSFAGQSDPIPFAPVTILVGANASGKSNVFDAIRFLRSALHGFVTLEIAGGFAMDRSVDDTFAVSVEALDRALAGWSS